MHFDEDSQIAFGSPEQVVLAMHCEQLSPADKKEKRTYPSKYANAILCVEPELYDTNKDVKKSVDNCLKEGVEIVFDCRDVECPVTIGTDRRLHYHGEITERLAMSIAKTMFSTSVNRIWSQSFIVSKSSRSKLPQGMCVVFANLLMLDGDTVQLPTGSGSGSAFKGEIADIMSSAVFDSSKLSEKAVIMPPFGTRLWMITASPCVWKSVIWFTTWMKSSGLLPMQPKSSICPITSQHGKWVFQ